MAMFDSVERCLAWNSFTLAKQTEKSNARLAAEFHLPNGFVALLGGIIRPTILSPTTESREEGPP
jgi:hypothetical protein